MASSLSQLLLTQSRSNSFATRKALLVLDLQDDFVQGGGKLPVTLRDGFQKHLIDLTAAFREASSEVVWVRSEFESPQPVNEGSGSAPIIVHADPVTSNGKPSDSEEDSEEEMLRNALDGKRASWGARPSAARMAAAIRRSSSRNNMFQPASSRDAFLSKAEGLNTCCLPGTEGSRLCSLAQQALDASKDLQTIKNTYSAFDMHNTRLLSFLRSRLVTELYLCGSLTNISVYATASDAVRHGFEVYVIDDCLGYRNESAHDEALARMVDVMCVLRISSAECLVQMGAGVKAESPGTTTPSFLTGTSYTQMNGSAEHETRPTEIPDSASSSKDVSLVPAGNALARGITTGQTLEPANTHATPIGASPGNSLVYTLPASAIMAEQSSKSSTGETDSTADHDSDIFNDHESSAVVTNTTTPLSEEAEISSKSEESRIDILSTPIEDDISIPSLTTATPIVDAAPDPANPAPAPRLQSDLPPATNVNDATSKNENIPQDSNSNSAASAKLSDMTHRPGDTSVVTEELPIRFPGREYHHWLASIAPPEEVGQKRGSSDVSRMVKISPTLPIHTKELSSDTPPQSLVDTLPSQRPNTNLDGRSAQPDLSHIANKQTRKNSMKARTVTHPTLGPNDCIGEGDSRVVYDAISSTNTNIFTNLKNEVHWQKMSHAQGEVPRLVCAQGFIDPVDGSMPVYRHPSDQSLPLLHFSRTVRKIRDQVQIIVGHPMNHVLIQLYRGGQDNISEHSDKTLDIVRGSSIVNVSLGAQRTMRLRTKKSATMQPGGTEVTRRTQLVPLPHGSAFVLGPQTNMAWLHGINADKRPSVERSAEELAFCGERVSLTFRHIGTCLDTDSNKIWGQGACSKSKEQARCVINGDPESTQAMIYAFGFENQQTSFDWDKVYGNGFDVLHFTQNPSQELPLVFTSGNLIDDTRVKLCLEELGLPYHITGVSRSDAGYEYKPTLCFRDTDAQKTEVYGMMPILLYLNQTRSPIDTPKPVSAEALRLLWTHACSTDDPGNESILAAIEDFVEERDFAAGTHFSIADCFFWPFVDVAMKTRSGTGDHFPLTQEYWRRLLKHESVAKVMENGT